MSKSFKKKFIVILSFVCIIFIFSVFMFLRIQGVLGTYMHLIGDSEIKIEINEGYEEKGVLVRKNFEKITRDIKIQSNVDTTKIGKYEVSYMYLNSRINRTVEVVDREAPMISLIGDPIEILFKDDVYEEKGVNIVDNSKQDLNKNLKITNNVDSSSIGEYKVIYQVHDDSNNESNIERIVKVVENPMALTLHYHYDKLDNQRIGWWFKKASDHERKPATYDEKLMKQYSTYYLGADEKVIYLTFDEGGNHITYIKEITDILNNQGVKATYFLTRNYISSEAGFMKKLVSDGHEIGNHTRSHLDMTTLANSTNCDKFVSEIMDTQKTIYEVTKVMPPLIFRFPKGEFSMRTLAMVSDLGYKTYFWSHAYNDYENDVSKEEAYNNLVSHLHAGAIYLLHPSNKGNYEAMNDFIMEAKKQGYAFELVSAIE